MKIYIPSYRSGCIQVAQLLLGYAGCSIHWSTCEQGECTRSTVVLIDSTVNHSLTMSISHFLSSGIAHDVLTRMPRPRGCPLIFVHDVKFLFSTLDQTRVLTRTRKSHLRRGGCEVPLQTGLISCNV